MSRSTPFLRLSPPSMYLLLTSVITFDEKLFLEINHLNPIATRTAGDRQMGDRFPGRSFSDWTATPISWDERLDFVTSAVKHIYNQFRYVSSVQRNEAIETNGITGVS